MAEKNNVSASDFKCFTPEGMARQLEGYTKNVFAVLEDYQVLYGSAISMRKAIDSMGAYLVAHYCDGGDVKPETDGTVGDAKRNPILSRIIVPAKKNVDLRQFKMYWEEILPDRDSENRLQFLFHYQSADAPADRYREDEKKNLMRDYSVFFGHLLSYQELTKTFLTIASEVAGIVREKRNEYPMLSGILSGSAGPDAQLNSILSQQQHVQKSAADSIEGIYSDREDDIDPWMNWHCRILSLFSGKKEDQLYRDLCALICRKIGERTTCRFVLSVNPDEKIGAKATYKDYLELLTHVPPETPEYYKVIEYSCLGNLLSSCANNCLHWHAADNEHLAETNKLTSENYQSCLWSAARIVSGEITDKHPEYAFEWYCKINNQNIISDRKYRRLFEETEVKLRELYKDNARRKKLEKILRIVIIVLSLILIAALSFGIKHLVDRARRQVITTGYYSNYTWRYGVPEGVGEIKKGEAKSRAHYEIDVQDGKIIEVRFTDANGNLMNEIIDSYKGRPAMIRVDYDDEKPDEISFFDEDRQFLLTAKYEYDPETEQIVSIQLLDQTRHALSLPNSTTRVKLSNWLGSGNTNKYAPGTSKIASLTVKEMKNGQFTQLAYGWDEVSADGKNVTGLRLEYTSGGLVEKITFEYESTEGRESENRIRKFYYDGSALKHEEMINVTGASKYLNYEWDEKGNCVSESYMDTLDSLVADQKGLSRIAYRYSPVGRVIETRRIGINGNLIATDSDWAVKICEWDDQGRELTCSYLDAFEKPVLVDGFALRRSSYEDKNGETRRMIRWYDEKGNPGFSGCEYTNGVNTVTETETGRILLYERFSEDGTPALYDGAYQWKETEDRNGNLCRIDLLDADGVLMVSEKEQFAYKVNHFEQHRLTQEEYFDAEGNPYRGNRRYSRRVFAYTTTGLQKDIWEYDQDQLVIHKHITYENGNSGRITREEYLDADGSLVLFDAVGYAYMENTYQPSEKGTIVRTEYHDANGNLMMVTASAGIQYAASENEYDQNGYHIRETLYDNRGSKVYSPTTGCYTLIVERDGRGNAVAWEFRDQNDQLVMSGNGKGYARVEKEYNSNNQVIEEWFYDPDMQPFVSPKFGYAGRIFSYDEQTGQFLGTSFFNENRELVICPSYGYARMERKYDAAGNISKELFYDENDELFMVPDFGYAMVEIDYENGVITDRRYLDTDGNPSRAMTKSPIQHWSYDNGVKQAFDGYNADHVLIVHVDYRPDGSYTEYVSYTDAEAAEKGCAGVIRDRDADDKVLKETLTDENGKTVFSESAGYAVLVWELNETDSTRKLIYYDENDQRIINEQEGFSAELQTLNDKGQVVIVWYLDENDQPMICLNEEYAAFTKKYNSNGQITEERYYGLDGEPVILSSGASGYRWSYDEDGQIVSAVSLNADGQPFKDLGEQDGIDTREFYDEKGQTIKWAYYDLQGNLILHPAYGYAYVEKTYDGNGNTTSISFFDTEGVPVVSWQLGYARVEDQYDSESRSLGWTYYGPDGRIMDNEVAGYARKEVRRDAAGNEIETSFYSADGALICLDSKGFARRVQEFDSYNHLTLVLYYGEENLPEYNYDDGCCGYRLIYDEAGRIIRKEFLGEEGELICSYDEGPAIIRYDYNDEGLCTRVRYYDPDENPFLCEEETLYYGKKYQYDEDGKMISVAYLNFDGTLISPNPDEFVHDYSMCLITYDEQGNHVADTYCDTDGEPFDSKSEGCCTWRFNLDENGFVVWEEFYDTAGRKIFNTVYGYASAEYELDSDGDELSARYYDLDGNEIEPDPEPSEW